MNAWAVAALVLLAVPAPACLWVASRGTPVHRLVGASLLSSVAGAVFLVLPQAYGRSSYQDLALVLGVLAPAGTLVFTRFVSGRPTGHAHPPPTPDPTAPHGSRRAGRRPD